jgi:hypothetical protein
VRRRIDQPVDPVPSGRFQLRVFAAHGIDLEGFSSQRRRNIVCIETSGVDDSTRLNRLALEPHREGAVGTLVAARDARVAQHDGAGRFGQPLQHAHERLCLEPPRSGRPEGCLATDVRLAAADEIGPDDFEPLGAVGRSQLAQRLESPHLGLGFRDDELPAALVRHAVPRAELVQQPRALDA